MHCLWTHCWVLVSVWVHLGALIRGSDIMLCTSLCFDAKNHPPPSFPLVTETIIVILGLGVDVDVLCGYVSAIHDGMCGDQ